MNNIILMGPPGAGKTTVAKVLSKRLSKPVYDIDDDHLEVVWGMSVAEKLAHLGDEGFLDEEGKALLTLQKENHVISLTGSNPLHTESMQHVRTLGTMVFLDVPSDVIVSRLNTMKVNRIVGQSTKSMEEILAYRRSFYEKCYDIRISVCAGDTPDQIADVIEESLASKVYKSTRATKETYSFAESVLVGLAPDGGLFVPSFSFPKIRLERLLEEDSYTEKALRILEFFMTENICPQDLRMMLKKTYSSENFSHKQIVPIRKLEKNHFILELFHGPTASFKDVALQLTPKLFSYASNLLDDKKQKTLILTATSGDTGSAAIEGFRHEPNISVMTLFPENGVSKIQAMQMVSLDGANVRAVAVKADFDVCQSAVKKIFQDTEIRNRFLTKYNTRLSAANSMNWGRLLPQVVYFFTGYLEMVKQGVCRLGEEIDVCVPTGNFGNILSALYAKKMGLPIGKLLCASNENRILTDFLGTGIYDIRERTLHKTISPSIDILKSSNLERLLFLLSDGNSKFVKKYYSDLDEKGYFQVSEAIQDKMRELFYAGYASEEETKTTIQEVFARTGVLLDPHTAVAKKVADEYNGKNPMLITATAHFGKFLPAVLSALGEEVDEDDLSAQLSTLNRIAPRELMHPKLLPFFVKTHLVPNHIVEGGLEEIVREAEKLMNQGEHKPEIHRQG